MQNGGESSAGVSDTPQVWPATDVADAEQAAAGCHDAFDRIVRRYQDTIAQTMWRFTRDRRAWEELVHDVFVEAFTSLHTYRGRAPLVHWLKKIATRVGYRFWRNTRYKTDREAVNSDLVDAHAQGNASESPAIEASEAAEMVHNMLARLRPRDRLVLTLMYLEECSVAEVAERTGWSVSMVKVQAHRARNRLKSLLDDREAIS